MVDGYRVYDTLANENDALLLTHRWAHARRKLVEAEPNYPQCTEALPFINELFATDGDTADPGELDGDAKRWISRKLPHEVVSRRGAVGLGVLLC